MNLRSRALLILGLTFLVFLLILTVVMYSATVSGMDRIENEDLADAVNQTTSGISAESAALLGTAQDWGTWDEMYQYARVPGGDFIDRNANPDNMATVRIHLFMVLDPNGTLIYGRILSPDFATNESIPDSILRPFQENPGLSHLPADRPGIAGILDTSDGPMIVAATPILRSDGSGPAAGTLVMGRIFNYGPLQRISNITGYSLSLTTRQGSAPNGYTPPPPLSGQSPAALQWMSVARNESTITGYSLQKDLAGRDFELGVSLERSLHRIGNANLTTYIILFSLWAIITMLVVLLVIDRVVLLRMAALADHVGALSDRPGEVPTPVLSGEDELSALERTIIASRAGLLLREEQLRAFVNAMPGPAALFSLEGTILMANPALQRVLSPAGPDLTGTRIQQYFPPSEVAKYDRYVQETIRRKEAVHFENEYGGKTILMSYYPLIGSSGEVVQLGLVTFDISERKRLENALQKVTRKIALLNTVIFSDIQNKVFVQTGYIEIARQMAADPKLKEYLEKEADVVREIQDALRFARQYNDMGASPPRWQNVQDVMLFAISHLDLGPVSRDFQLGGIEIFADSLLERVFVTLVENALLHAQGATTLRAGYQVTGDDALIFVEDNGPGIPEDRKETIFEKGLGTGGSGSLFLSREILSITGITITENGIPGKGARFEMHVPKDSYRFSGR